MVYPTVQENITVGMVADCVQRKGGVPNAIAIVDHRTAIVMWHSAHNDEYVVHMAYATVADEPQKGTYAFCEGGYYTDSAQAAHEEYERRWYLRCFWQ